MIIIHNKYNLADIVYLKTDPEQCARLITAIQVLPTGIIYRLVCNIIESWHYDFEICYEKVFNESLYKKEVK